MADIEILVRLKNGPPSDNENFRTKKGDPIEVREVGHVGWGPVCDPDGAKYTGLYGILTITDVPYSAQEAANRLMDGDPDDQNDNEPRYRRAWTFALANLPTALRNQMNPNHEDFTGRLSRSYSTVLTFIKHKRLNTDYDD